MSVDALFDTTMALRRRIRDATGAEIHIGAPLRREMGNATVALALLDIQPSKALRNEPYFAPAPASGPVAGPGTPINAVPLDLRYLIACFRPPTTGGVAARDPGELRTLGRIVGALHADPVLSGATLPGQEVRLSPEPYGLDELNRLWALFPETPFRSSVVYLATPVYVEVGDAVLYPPVSSRELDGGLAAEPPERDAA